MRANEIQVGGDHYRRGGDVQHWDVIDRNGIGYLEGVASKYVCRHREKNGLQDLRKAEHYLMKLLEEVREHGRRPRGVVSPTEMAGLRRAYALDAVEYSIVNSLLTWSFPEVLEAALKDVRDLIKWAEMSEAKAGQASSPAVG